MQGSKSTMYKGSYVSQKEYEASLYRQQKMSPLFCITGDTIKELLHRSIVALRYENPLIKNRFICGSGVLLSEDLVLTAAHNLYDKRQDIQFQRAYFKIFEATDDGFVEIFHKIKDWRYLEDFKTCKHSQKLQYDYALIKLEPNPVKPITYNQFLELRPPCKCVLEKDPQVELEIYGYPSQYKHNYEPVNKQFTKLKLFQYGLTISGGIVEVDLDESKITYAISTLPGQSGCPVVVGNQVISIHNGADGKEQDKWNIGRLITSDLVQNVKAWAKQLGGNPYYASQEMFCPHQPQKIHSSTIAGAEQLKASAGKLKEEYKYDLALEQYKKSMAIYGELKGKDSAEVAAILVYGIGDIYEKQGKYSAALEALERGKAIYEEKEGGESYNYAVSLHQIGWVYDDRAEYDLALDNYNKALAIWQKIEGKDSVKAGDTINNIGSVYWSKGEYAQALQYLKRSLQIRERAGKGNSIGAANTHNNIGNVYNDQKEYQKALQHYQKALAIYQSIQGKDSVDAALTMMNIDQQSTVEQEMKHRNYALAHLNLGVAYNAMKDYKSAAAAYRVSLPIYEQMGLAAEVKKSSLYLARCLSRLGEKGELERIVKEYGVVRSEI